MYFKLLKKSSPGPKIFSLFFSMIDIMSWYKKVMSFWEILSFTCQSEKNSQAIMTGHFDPVFYFHANW